MTGKDFQVAKKLERDGWTYEYLGDDGDMVFTRVFGTITYNARVKVDR